MVEKDLVLPKYEIGIFRVLPTLLQTSLKIDIPEPYSEFSFTDKRYTKLFDEADISVIVILDSLCMKNLDGFIRDSWKKLNSPILSSIVPTTTANAIGSIYIGLPPEESGLIAQRFYLSEIGNYIDALSGKVPGVGESDSLGRAGVRLSSLLWKRSILESIASNDFLVVDLLPKKLSGGLQRFYEEGIFKLHYATELDGAFEVIEVVRKMIDKKLSGLIFVYYPELDTMSHLYGYQDFRWSMQLRRINETLSFLHDQLNNIAKETNKRISMLIISDHGHVNISENLAINEEDWKTIAEEFGLAAYMSSARFAFIYLRTPDAVENIDLERLSEALFNNKAYIFTIDEAIKMRFWPLLNDENIDLFMSRAGDLVVVYKYGIEAYMQKRSEEPIIDDVGWEYRKNRGSHGGLTEEEMFIPFVIFNLPE